MYDNGPSEHALRPDQFYLFIGYAALGVSFSIGFEVAEIANVAFFVGGGAVSFAEGVDYREVVIEGFGLEAGAGDYDYVGCFRAGIVCMGRAYGSLDVQ